MAQQEYVTVREHNDLKESTKANADAIEALRLMQEKQIGEISTLKAMLMTAKWIIPTLTAIIGAESTAVLMVALHIV